MISRCSQHLAKNLSCICVHRLNIAMHLQMYSVALFVEPDQCASELRSRCMAGGGESDGDLCAAITEGNFNKVYYYFNLSLYCGFWIGYTDCLLFSPSW